MSRFAVLVLAPPRARWAERLRSWSREGALDAEVVACRSPEEVRARLLGARRYSALVVDDATGADRDLLAASAAAGCAPLVVRRTRSPASWVDIGAAAELTDGFGPAELAAHLEVAGLAAGVRDRPPGDSSPAGHVVAVCGPGGTGASSVAAALAQGLADRWGETALADLARHGEQAMLHDVPARSAGVEALVEAHRSATLGWESVRRFAHPVPARGYDLLVGLRRARAWSVLRPRAVAAALSALRSGYDVVVCDTDTDLEGEAEGGSLDVEERNALARTAFGMATAAVVVAMPGLKGTHSLVRVLGDVWSHGGEPSRTIIVVNRPDRRAPARAIVTALGRLLSDADLRGMPAPVVVEHCAVEDAFVTGAPLPLDIVEPVTAAVVAALDATRAQHVPSAPEPVAPGTLGSWHPELDS